MPHPGTPAKAEVPHIVLSEEEAASQGWYFKKKSRNRIRLTKYTGTESNVIIPSQIGDYTVNELKKWLFYKSQIGSVQIPDTVRKIGEDCFRESTVQRIVIAAPVTEIPYAFAFGCLQLREVIFPRTVSMIGNSAFGSCKNLTEIRFPDSLREIGEHAFRRSGLSSFTATHGELIHAHGTAFDETTLCDSYRMIASSYSKKNGYRMSGNIRPTDTAAVLTASMRSTYGNRRQGEEHMMKAYTAPELWKSRDFRPRMSSRISRS